MIYTVKMKNLKIIVTLVILTFLIAVLAAGWYWLESDKFEPIQQENNAPIKKEIKETVAESVAPPKTVPALQDELATPSTALTNFEWNIGTRQTYRYQLQTDLKVDIAATLKQDKNAPTQWQHIQTQFSGILNLRVFAKNHDRIQVGVQLSQVDYQLNQQKFELLTALLQTFFLVEMSPEGKPLYYHFPRYIDHSNQVFLKELIDNIQFSLNANPIAPNWTTQETHGSGGYEAKYQREAENKFKKQKVKYTYVTFQQSTTEKTEQLPIKLTGEVKHSESTAQLMKQVNWLYLLDGKEEAEFSTVSGTLAQIMAQVHLGFSRDAQDSNLGIWRAPDDFDAVIQQFATAQGDVSLSENVIKQLERDKLRQQYANVSVAQLIDAMKSTDAKNANSWQALRDYLAVYPQVALEIPNLLETADRDLANKIISVLEIVATPEAQQALSTIATHPSQEEAPQQRAVQAIIAFNFVEQPQPQVVETLKKLANSPDNERSDTALLAMGSVLEHTAGSIQVEVRDEINRRLENSAPEQKPTLLRAIGNSRDSSFLPKVTPYFADSSVDVRTAATEAVRKFQDAESLGYLLNALTQDADRQVRLSALDSLKQREDKLQALPKLKEQLLQETDPELKAKLIQFLGAQKANDSQIVDVLKQSLQQETDRDMKKHLYNEIYR